MATSNGIDFESAKRKILRKRVRAAGAGSRPLQPRLLTKVRATFTDHQRGALRAGVALGFALHDSTDQIVRSMRRDAVRQAARAAL